MFKQKILFFSFLFFVCINSKLFSQIIATPSIGCGAGSSITFSGPAGASNPSWSFGNGNGSNLATASTIYTTSGTYNVTYTAIVGGTVTSLSLSFTVNPRPVPNFSFTLPASRCAPLNACFTNLSTGAASINVFQWNFGNGGGALVQNPCYNYPSSGSFSVSLTVSDINGCSSASPAILGPINVSNPPTIIINTLPSPPSGCTAPFTCSFNGANSISGSPVPPPSLSYTWSFPGGSPASSNGATPGNVVYSAVGNYVVTLTIKDNNNCSAIQTIPVSVSQPTLSSVVPATVCPNTPFTISLQTNQAQSNWQMVNGFLVIPTTGPVTSFTHAYATPGTYTIQTSVGNFPCAITQTKVIFVQLITASISVSNPSFACSNPLVATYSNASSPNAISYSWSSTGCPPNAVTYTSNVANPTFSFTQGSLNMYTIFQDCIPTVNLIVTSAAGCTAVASVSEYTLRRPTAWFLKNKKEGCAPLVVTFRDSSFASPSPSVITSYTWNNGASPPTIVSGVSPPIPNVTFTYNSPGTYTPFLTIQTAQGCTDISFIDTVKVVNTPSLSFSFSPSIVCANTPVQIINTSPSSLTVQHWHITSDAGYFSGCISNPNPSWNFTHIGVHSFSMSAWQNSCPGSTTIPQTVTVNGPIVQSRFETNCTNRKTVLFATQIQDALNTSLNFGDGTPTVSIAGILGAVINHTINHTYANTGDKTVTVISSNGSGTCSPYTYTMLVQVRDVQADIALSNTTCINYNNLFSAATSTDVLVTCSTGYTWYFDNAPPTVSTTPVTNYSFPGPGTHTVTLEVKDVNSCSSAITKTIHVSTALPQFTSNLNPICLSNGTVQFINSTPNTPDPIINFSWNFGDGSVLSGAPGPTITNPTHTYVTAAVPQSTFLVTLVATNSLGCSSQTTMVMTVTKPDATMIASPGTSICVGQTVTITAPAGYQTYSLSWGDLPNTVYTGTNNVWSHPYTLYTTTSGYTANLSVTDINGCKNSSVLVFSVQSYPAPSFSIGSPNATKPNVACLGDNIYYISTSTSSPAYSLTYNWNIGNGQPIVPDSIIVASYTATGIYLVTLTVSTSNGCKATTTRTVGVYSAKANLNLDKNTICLGQTINFNIKSDSSTVYAWDWDFGVGTVYDSILANPPPPPSQAFTYTYLPPGSNGIITVVLDYYSSGYSCRYVATQTIQIIKVDADFKRNNEISLADWSHCLGLSDQFNNTTPNAANSIFTWNFGNGNSSNQQNPVYTYTAPGVYPVTFTVVQQPNGCIGTASKNMTINPLPIASIYARDTCANSLFPLVGNISGNGPYTYTWTPAAGVTNPNALSTTASATVSTSYSLNVLDANGCVGSTVQNVYIQQAPKNIQWDTAVVIGQIIPVNGNAGLNLSYTWTPGADLSCTNCAFPTSTSTNNVTYTVSIRDALGCFTSTNTYKIIVEPKSTVDVPTAFTPNGDGINDIIYVDGWGIKKLKFFRIFNRWGQLLFESNDIKIGWDGTFNGVPQNMETYVYQVSCETYIDKDAVLKTGSFKLIR